MLAPAWSRPTSSVSSDTSFSCGGTSPRARRTAKPSTTAVLPTPASPVRIGLFWRRRSRMSTICRISSSRPLIGSISSFRAFSVRSTVKRFSASCLPICAGAIAPLVSPGAPAPKPSLAASPASDEPLVIRAKLSQSASTLMRSNCRDTDSSAFLSDAVLSIPTSRWPLRTWFSPNSSVP